MDKETPTVDTQPAVAEPVEVTATTQDDAEARIAALEADKAKAIEEAANYKLGMLKAKAKLKEVPVDDDESEDERIGRIVQEQISQTKIAQIDTEKEVLLKKLAKENKELKLAQLNKTNTPPAALGTHSESVPVRDTVVTPDQLNAFKAKGWSDKDIERYKKNLARYAVR